MLLLEEILYPLRFKEMKELINEVSKINLKIKIVILILLKSQNI